VSWGRTDAPTFTLVLEWTRRRSEGCPSRELWRVDEGEGMTAHHESGGHRQKSPVPGTGKS